MFTIRARFSKDAPGVRPYMWMGSWMGTWTITRKSET